MRLFLLWPIVGLWSWFALDWAWQLYVLKTGEVAAATVVSSRWVSAGKNGDVSEVTYRLLPTTTSYTTLANKDLLASLSKGTTFPVRVGNHAFGSPFFIPVIAGYPTHEFYQQENWLVTLFLIFGFSFYCNVVEPLRILRLIQRGTAIEVVITKRTTYKSTSWIHYQWRDERNVVHSTEQDERIWATSRFDKGDVALVMFLPGTGASTIYELAECEIVA